MLTPMETQHRGATNNNKPLWTGYRTAGCGVALANFVEGPEIDMVIFWVDNPSGANHGWYQTALDIKSNGWATSWSDKTPMPGDWQGVGDPIGGAGLATMQISLTSRPELFFMWIDDPLLGENWAYYRVQWECSNMRTQVRYFTNVTATVNGLNTERLDLYRNGISSYRGENPITDPEGEIERIYWGIRVWKRDKWGVETPISSGTVALVYRSAAGQGIQSATWNCSYTYMTTTDSLVVRVYRSPWNSVDGFWGWVQLDTWQTEQLNAHVLNSATWTVYYYTWASRTIGFGPLAGVKWYARFYFDTATHNSRIANIMLG